MKWLSLFMPLGFLVSCSSAPKYETKVQSVDIQKFMGQWYVIAGRFTPFEVDVYNAIETYTWNSQENRIDIDFTYNKGSLTGPVKKIPQKGWIYNKNTNSHWKVSPFWPLKLDYLILAVAEDYSWTVVGVPNQKYVWIMAKDAKISKDTVGQIMQKMKDEKYNMEEIIFVSHK